MVEEQCCNKEEEKNKKRCRRRGKGREGEGAVTEHNRENNPTLY